MTASENMAVAPPGRHVLVMAKSPVPGRVKTRLCPPLTPREAAAVGEAALADTLEAVAGCGADRRVVALEGAPGPWLPPGFEVIPQRGGGLAERLAHAWADTGGAGIQVGMDTPQVSAADLDEVLALLDGRAPDDPDPRNGSGGRGSGGRGSGGRTAVLGPALDGGWWVIGLPHLAPVDLCRVFCGIPMSTSSTGFAQDQRLRRLGHDVVAAPVRRDIDTIDDLAAVAADAPGSRTAAVAARLTGLAGCSLAGAPSPATADGT